MNRSDKVFMIACAVLIIAAIVGLCCMMVRAQEEEPIGVSCTDAEIIAQILYHECRGLPKLEQSAVVWTILNRVDSAERYFPDTIEEVCRQRIKQQDGTYIYMFAYREDAPIEEDLYNLAVDVLVKWEREKRGETDVGRTLPKEYLYFWGDGKHNYFRKEYQGKNYWDWSMPDPYKEGEN